MHGGQMHIACPNCHTVYDVPESKLDNALSLRCFTCNYSWPLAPAKAANRQNTQSEQRHSSSGATPGAARQPQPEGETAGQASQEPQQSGSVSSVTVASMTVSSVTVTSNQPAATAAETVADMQPEAESVFSRMRAQPASFTEPPLTPEEDIDPIADFAPLTAEDNQRERLRKPDAQTGQWANTLLGGALLVMIALTLAILARQEIIKWLPISGKLFKALGLD